MQKKGKENLFDFANDKLFSFRQLDSKKSPLALLAQTCSQIGADSNSVKAVVVEKSKKMDTQAKPTANSQKMDKVNELVYKPYEKNVLSRKGDEAHRPISKSSSFDENLSDESEKSKATRAMSRNSSRESPVSVNSNNDDENNTEKSLEKNGSSDKSHNNENNNSPVMSQKDSPSAVARSNLEYHQSQQQRDMGFYKPGFNSFYPAGIDPSNPAFRSSFSSALSQHHASMLANAGYQANANNPYLSYTRIKTASGGEVLAPVCKDPYCNGCQYSAHNQQLLMGVPCPAGCTQCEQQKYGLAMAMSTAFPPNHPFMNQISKPFSCNWILTDGYCGRRFSTTDELIQHMKTHSPNLSDPATAASILAAQQSASLMSPLFFPAGMHRLGYPTSSPLSPMPSTRFHPYAKPGSLPASYGSFNPALSAYYPPYSWMPPQRLGAAAHP